MNARLKKRCQGLVNGLVPLQRFAACKGLADEFNPEMAGAAGARFTVPLMAGAVIGHFKHKGCKILRQAGFDFILD